MNLKLLLKEKEFIFIFETSPGRKHPENLEFFENSTQSGLIDCISITENLGGSPALPPDFFALKLSHLSIPIILHFSCKDKNRNQIESELLKLNELNLNNLLIMTGDYPDRGFSGAAKPVFDLDAVHVLLLASSISPKFFKGAVINPFKLTVEETWLQYFKLFKKFKASADFVVTQSGFSPLKWKELKLLLETGLTKNLSILLKAPEIFSEREDERIKKIPVFGSIIYPAPRILDAIASLRIPGIILSEKVYEAVKNKKVHPVEVAAKLAAILKGLGFKGVHLCGFPQKPERLKEFRELFNNYLNNWAKLIDEFEDTFFYRKQGEKVKRKFHIVIKNEETSTSLSPIKPKVKLSFLISHAFHQVFFNEKSLLFPVLKGLVKLVSRSSVLTKLITKFEYTVKKWLYECKECGECKLYEFNYHCPQGGCAKGLLNGPCGGSIEGFCEVHPFTKKCVYVKAINSAPNLNSVKKLIYPQKGIPFLPPRNWKNYGKSSWINFFLEK